MTEEKTRESVFADSYGEVYAVYAAELAINDKIIGGIPRDPKIVQGWLRSKAGISEERELAQFAARTMQEQGVDLGVSADALMDMNPNEIFDLLDHVAEGYASERQTTGFKQDENGLYIENRQVKAMIKESVNVLFAGDRWGKTKKGPRSFSAERVFIEPQRIHLGTMEPDNILTFVGHVTDKSGPRSTLGLHEYVEQPVLDIEVHVVNDEITPDQWCKIWLHAQHNGLGALRSQGFGTFVVSRWERIR